MEHATSIVDVRTATILFSLFILRPSSSFVRRDSRLMTETLSLDEHVRGRPKTVGAGAAGEPAGKTLVNHRQDQDSGDDDQRRRSRECLSTPPASPVGIVSRSRPIHGGTGGKSARARDTPGTRLRERRSMCYIASSLLYESTALVLPSFSLSLSLSLGCSSRARRAIVDAYRRFDECYCVYRTLLCIFLFFLFFFFFFASLFFLSFFRAHQRTFAFLTS